VGEFLEVFMIRTLFAVGVCAVCAVATTGCAVRTPDYNPILGGFSKPAVYAGQLMPVAGALDANSQSAARAKPRVDATNVIVASR
jgi:hypothetical protein